MSDPVGEGGLDLTLFQLESSSAGRETLQHQAQAAGLDLVD